MSILVIDKTEESELRDLFTLFGTPYKATKLFWLNPPLMIITGIVVAFAVAPVADTTGKIIAGIIYGLIILATSFLHELGHIISSRQVGAPVTYIIMSMTVANTYYNDSEDLPSRVHIGRAIGGPLTNLIAGIIGIVSYGVMQSHFVAFFAVLNILFFIVTILPIPTIDGDVIWRELRK